MKKNIIVVLIIMAVMFLMPYVTVKFIPGDAGMALCFIMFFCLNPLFSLIIGVYSGMSYKHRYFIPVVLPVTYLISCFLLFDADKPAFYIYAVAYLLISYVSYGITAIIKCFTHNAEK